MTVLERTQRHSGTFAGVLRLGILSAPAAGPDLLTIVDVFTARHPDCRVEVAQVSPPLRSALVWHRRTSDARGRELVDIARDILRRTAAA
jgi:hypothetical protein